MTKLDYEPPRPPKPWLSERERVFLAVLILFVSAVILIILVMLLH